MALYQRRSCESRKGAPRTTLGAASRDRTRIVAFLLALGFLFVLSPGSGRAAEPPKQDHPALRLEGIAPERAEVNLLLVDVLVSARGGRPARGLKKEDFDLLIDGLSAPIATFEDHCSDGPPPAAPPGKAAEEAPAEGRGQPRHIVVIFDLNHLTRAGRDRSLAAATKFVREEMTENDRVMLIALKDGPILLEPFTSDRAALASRLEAVKADNDLIDLDVLMERFNSMDILRRDCHSLDDRCQPRLNVALPYALEEEARAHRTLRMLTALMPALGGMRGRKTMLLFAETLRDEPGLQYLILAGSTPRQEGIYLTPLLVELQRAANAANVSLYPVWAAGLGEGGGTGQADASVKFPTADLPLVGKATLAGEDAALGLSAALAVETAGKAILRSNDLGKAFAAVEEDLSCYYVLGHKRPGPGDGKRHSIGVRTRAKGYDLRARPYFEDWSEEERLDRRFRSALLAPVYYRDLQVTAEAYALVPGEEKTQILLKVEFPLGEATLIGQPDGRRVGEVEVRGTVWTAYKETFQFARKIPLSIEPGEEVTGRKVVYETGCDLPPGSHSVTVAVLDSTSWEIGAAETNMPVRARAKGIAGDVLLWTSSAGDVLVASDAGAVGIRDSGSGHGFVPRAERRFGQRETGLLYVIVCPPLESEVDSSGGGEAGEGGRGRGPIEVSRTIYVEDRTVATFPRVTLGEEGGAGPDAVRAPTSCEGIFTTVTPGRLGPGGYIFEVQVTGLGPVPQVRRAGFAVDAAPAAAPIP